MVSGAAGHTIGGDFPVSAHPPGPAIPNTFRAAGHRVAPEFGGNVMVSHEGSRTIAGRSVNGVVALAFGAVFVVVGLAGFLVSGGHPAVGPSGAALLGLFQVNVLHNVVHLVIGAVLIAAALRGDRPARTANRAVGVLYLVLFVAGLFLVGTGLNLVALNASDNILHLVLGIALAGVGFGVDRH
ncbi:MAG: DUF4383 domain-containing protein [Pseudonocardia sp.]|nr:DUF4383 domain-containing protein [Pseudonocardia sp.]